jgi:hypothetical protein
VAPITEKRTKGAWYQQWRLNSLDGGTLALAGTEENAKASGRPAASRGVSAFPKIRLVALLENGTQVLRAARMGKYATGGITLAHRVVPALGKGMLCLADRCFASYDLWQRAAKTGADVLWRVRPGGRRRGRPPADGAALAFPPPAPPWAVFRSSAMQDAAPDLAGRCFGRLAASYGSPVLRLLPGDPQRQRAR